MYNTKLNNYHSKPKNSKIYTPPVVSAFIFTLLKAKIPPGSLILDPCVGKGSLLKPGKANQGETLGVDIDPQSKADYIANFFDFYCDLDPPPSLILCNPPFNGAKPKLAPELGLAKILELFGKEIPIVLFAPVGLRICNDLKSKRGTKGTNGIYPAISSIITIPQTIFPNVKFHAEILIFNIPDLKPHYFYHEKT